MLLTGNPFLFDSVLRLLKPRYFLVNPLFNKYRQLAPDIPNFQSDTAACKFCNPNCERVHIKNQLSFINL